MINTDKVATQVANHLHANFGFAVTAEPPEESRSRDGSHYFNMAIEQSFGVFAMIIKDAEVRVRVSELTDAPQGEKFYVHIALHYNHVSGGSNGSNVGTIWLGEDYSIVHTRMEGVPVGRPVEADQTA